MKDYLNFENSITGSTGQPVPAVVSFKVQWKATGSVNNFNNAAQKFRGTFRNAMAQLEYRIRTVDFDITSAPLAASTTVAAELGQELQRVILLARRVIEVCRGRSERPLQIECGIARPGKGLEVCDPQYCAKPCKKLSSAPWAHPEFSKIACR